MIILYAFLLIFTFLLFFKWRYTYWKNKKVPYLPPRIFFGNIQNPLTRSISTAEEYTLFYNAIKLNGWKHAGVFSFSTPVYVPTDLEYIKNILAKDFQYFDERGRYYNEKDDPISAHLFNIGGAKWKTLRKKFTPTFSSAKLKSMFENVQECGRALDRAAALYCESQEPVEVKQLANNFTAEVIGLCVFGVHFNTFSNAESELLQETAKFLKGSLMEAARMVITFSFPRLSRFLRVRRYDKEATQYFTKIITELVDHRESNGTQHNDFLQILIGLKNGIDGSKSVNDDDKPITMDELIAQAMIFFIAGYDSTATTVALSLYELSINTQIQEKARAEVQDVVSKAGGELTYEAAGELKYIQQILSETLRKYPPLAILNRQSNAAYKIPDTDVVLDKGTPLIIPLLGLHYDPEYFPNPNKYDPNRFSAENVANIKPFSYLPFGEGPKGCLGTRFGTLNVKMALSVLLKKYRFTLNSKTRTPFRFEMGILNNVKGGIWLNIEKL